MSLTDQGRFTRDASLARPTTPSAAAEDSHLRAVTRKGALAPSHLPSNDAHPCALMTAILYAELDGTVPDELVAEIVQAVWDERRQGAQDGSAELMMLEARQRLDRFARARSAS